MPSEPQPVAMNHAVSFCSINPLRSRFRFHAPSIKNNDARSLGAPGAGRAAYPGDAGYVGDALREPQDEPRGKRGDEYGTLSYPDDDGDRVRLLSDGLELPEACAELGPNAGPGLADAVLGRPVSAGAGHGSGAARLPHSQFPGLHRMF